LTFAKKGGAIRSLGRRERKKSSEFPCREQVKHAITEIVEEGGKCRMGPFLSYAGRKARLLGYET